MNWLGTMISRHSDDIGKWSGFVITLASIGILMGAFQGELASAQQQNARQETLDAKVARLFSEFLDEKFKETHSITPSSGWVMPLPSGRKVTRSFLQRQASSLIKLGRDAVPHLFKWVRHDDLAIRYIAIYSLQEITRLKPYVSHFDKEDNLGYRENAILAWKGWWESRK